MALSVCGAYAEEQAADYTANASVTYQLTLEDYVKITALAEDTSYESETKFGTDYSNITIDGTLFGGFNVISNAPSRTMELTASCPGGSTTALYGGSGTGEEFNLVFTKVGATTDIDTALANITGLAAQGQQAQPVAADSNANAIAFGVTVETTHEHGGAAGITSAWDDDKITYTMANGVSDIKYTVSGSNVANTFNTKDESGTYQATLTLTDKSHT